jgi:hypothetical protein
MLIDDKARSVPLREVFCPIVVQGEKDIGKSLKIWVID